MTTKDGLPHDASASRRTRQTGRKSGRNTDWLVAIAALPIAGAFGAASYVHMGTNAWFAGAAAAVSYAAMLAVNKLVRRSRQADELRGELALLQSEIDRLAGRVANDTGPVMPTMRIPSAPLPPEPNLTSADLAADLALDQGRSFGRRKTAPAAPPPQAAPGGADSFGGYTPWPEMPPEPKLAPPQISQQAAPQAEIARQPAPATAPPAAQANPKNYERLQHLVKQLASEVSGPKATTPDPDRRPAAPPPHDGRTPPKAAAPAPQARYMPQSPSPDVSRVLEAIEAERVDVYLDPIQALDERKPRHFEVAVRFRDSEGQLITPDVMDPIVRAAGLGPRIDIVKLPRAARVAERVQSRGRPSDVLSAVTGDSLADQSFIGQINNVLGETPPAGMVLSFTQADVRRFGRLHWESLATLSDMGLRFAVDHVTDLDMDFEALKARRFDFVKLDATVFLDGLPAAGGYVSARDICRHFSSIGLALVVGKIASERDLAEILGFGVLLGQGALFGAPRPVRQDILARVQAA